MIKFQKNKTQLFQCKIMIEGADKSTAKPRLILYPKNDSRNIFFEGTIDDGICSINILPNLNVSDIGKAVLEVIVENSIIFQPWTTEYEIVTEKVKVDEINISHAQIGASVKVIEDDIKINNKNAVINTNIRQTPKRIVEKNKTFDSLVEEAAKLISDDKIENKKLLKAYNESISSLSKVELSHMIKFVRESYKPTTKTIAWAKQAIGDSDSVKSKLLMYCHQLKNREK